MFGTFTIGRQMYTLDHHIYTKMFGNLMTSNQVLLTSNQVLLTKYECAKIIGVRANQLSMSAPILVQVPETMKSNFIYIATKELKHKVLDIYIRRPLPHNKEYSVHLKNVQLPEDVAALQDMMTPFGN